MHSLAILMDLPEDAMYLALGDYLAERVDAVGLDRLRPIERTLWLVREFHWVAHDGGLLGYRIHPSSQHADDAVLALSTVGAELAASVLRQAIAVEGDISELAAHPGLSDEVEDLPLLVCRYALAHREAILAGGSAE